MSSETFLRRLKVKVIGVIYRSKLSYIELVWAITGTFMHGFQNNFVLFFSLGEVEVPFKHLYT